MSSDINSFNHSIELEPAKLNYKSELNALWAYFMTAYNYSKYYTDKEIKQSNDITKDNRIKAIKKLSSFFQKYNIKILSNDSLYSTTNKNILKEAKIWIMYIIINIRKETTISSICNIFDYAINNNYDQFIKEEVLYLALIGVLIILTIVFQYIYEAILNIVFEKVIKQIRDDVFTKLNYTTHTT